MCTAYPPQQQEGTMPEFPFEGVAVAIGAIGITATVALLLCCCFGLIKTDD